MDRDWSDDAACLDEDEREDETHRDVNQELVVAVDQTEDDSTENEAEDEVQFRRQVSEHDVAEQKLFHDRTKQDDHQLENRNDLDRFHDVIRIL